MLKILYLIFNFQMFLILHLGSLLNSIQYFPIKFLYIKEQILYKITDELTLFHSYNSPIFLEASNRFYFIYDLSIKKILDYYKNY